MSKPGPFIAASVGGVIAILISFAVYPILTAASDVLYLEYVDHCKVGSDNFNTIYPNVSGDKSEPDWDGTSLAVTNSSGICTTSATTPIATYFSEHGEKVAVVTTIGAIDNTDTTAKWTSTSEYITPYAVLEKYSGISTLILSILPIIATAGFLGVSAAELYKYSQSGGAEGITGIIMSTITTLLITIVTLYLAPTIFEFLQDAFAVSDDGRYTIMERFNGLVGLIMSFVPVIYISGLMYLFGRQGFSAYQSARETNEMRM